MLKEYTEIWVKYNELPDGDYWEQRREIIKLLWKVKPCNNVSSGNLAGGCKR